MNNLSLRQMRAFEAVARHGSFVAAADELCLTPSALSESIKQLEQSVGVRLLDRTTRRVALTDAGAGFLQDVRTALSMLGAATRRLAELRSLARGEVCLAAAPSVLTSLALPALATLGDTSRLRVTLREEGAEGIARLVGNAEADFGIGALPSSATRVRAEPLLYDRIGVVAPQGHALLSRRRLRIGDLAGERVVGLTADTAIAQLIAADQSAPETVRAPAMRVSNTVLLKLAVASGLGVALLPALAACEPAFAKLAFRPLDPTPGLNLQRCISFVQRVDRSLSPAAQELWRRIHAQVDALRRIQGIEVVAHHLGHLGRPARPAATGDAASTAQRRRSARRRQAPSRTM